MIKKAFNFLKDLFFPYRPNLVTLQDYIQSWRPGADVELYIENRPGRLSHQVFRSKDISSGEWDQLITKLKLRNQGWGIYCGTSYGMKGIYGIKQYTHPNQIPHLYDSKK